MHDICDEEVEEYFNDKLQIPTFVSLENDEFLFWNKLAYFLYTNNNTNKFTLDNKVYVEKASKPKKIKVKKIKNSDNSSNENMKLPKAVKEKENKNIKIPSQKLPKIHNRKFLLDETHTPINVTRTAPDQESTIGLRFIHENIDAKKSEWSLKNAYKPKESEFLKVFTDREEDNISRKKIFYCFGSRL